MSCSLELLQRRFYIDVETTRGFRSICIEVVNYMY